MRATYSYDPTWPLPVGDNLAHRGQPAIPFCAGRSTLCASLSGIPVGLPKSNIHRLTAFALLAGLSLATLVVGLVRFAAGLPPLGSAADWLAALLVGVLLSMALIVSLRLALRYAAHELRQAATELIGASLAFPPTRDNDALAVMRRTLAVAVAAVPRSASLSALAEALSDTVDAPSALDCAATLLARHLPVQGAALLLVDAECSALRPAAAWGSATLAADRRLDLEQSALGRALSERREAYYSALQIRELLPLVGDSRALSLFCLPLAAGGQLFGSLCLFAHDNDLQLNVEQRAFARAVTSLLTLALQSGIQRRSLASEQDRLAADEASLARQLFADRIAPASLVGLLSDDDALARVLAPQTCDVVALAVGLRGLERLRPQLSAALLSEHVLTPYYAALSAIAHEHHAYLSWRDDGGLWLIFGFPAGAGDLRAQALLAAQAVQTTARRLRGRWRTQLRREISVSAGVAAGPVVIATIGTGPASTLTLHGPTLREAARIQRLARSDEVLVDATLVAAGTPADPCTLEALSPLDDNARGAQRPIFRLIV